MSHREINSSEDIEYYSDSCERSTEEDEIRWAKKNNKWLDINCCSFDECEAVLSKYVIDSEKELDELDQLEEKANYSAYIAGMKVFRRCISDNSSMDLIEFENKEKRISHLFHCYFLSKRNYIVRFSLNLLCDPLWMANFTKKEFILSENIVLKFNRFSGENLFKDTSHLIFNGGEKQFLEYVSPVIDVRISFSSNNSEERFLKINNDIRAILGVALIMNLLKFSLNGPIVKNKGFDGLVDFGRVLYSSRIEFLNKDDRTRNFLCENLDFKLNHPDLFDFSDHLSIKGNKIRENANKAKKFLGQYVRDNVLSFSNLVKFLLEKNSQGNLLAKRLFLVSQWVVKLKLSQGFDKAINLVTIADILSESDSEKGTRGKGSCFKVGVQIAESISETQEQYERIKSTFFLVTKLRNDYVHDGCVKRGKYFPKSGTNPRHEAIKLFIKNSDKPVAMNKLSSFVFIAAELYLSKYFLKKIRLLGFNDC